MFFLLKFLCLILHQTFDKCNVNLHYAQNKRMNEYNGISATKIVQIYKHTFFKILLTG